MISIVMNLKHHLDHFLDTFPREDHVQKDPVQFVHRFSEPADREIVGFVAAAFSYGNVTSVIRSVGAIVERMGSHPARFVSGFEPRRDAGIFRGFYHRWNTERDLVVLLWILKRMVEEHGSLESLMVGGMDDTDGGTGAALDRFSAIALGFGHERFYKKKELQGRRGVRYFFPRVSEGSACKRLNLFMRWMVRADDGVDCGVWPRISPDRLVIPLDTHITRISRYIGLTELRSPNWKMALDITESLRRLDPSDPLKYDFALCHLGIAGDCPKKRDEVKCWKCPILAVCQL